MVEKFISCIKRRIDGGHNVICNVGPNVAILDVGLRNDDLASSYSGEVGSVIVSSPTAWEFSAKEEEGGEEKMKVLYVDQRDLFL